MIIAGFDLETTGFDGCKDHIVQSSFQIWDNDSQILNETTLVNPTVSIPNSHIHGISDDMVIDSPKEIDVVKSVDSLFRACFVDSIPVVIMNAAFDVTFYNNVIRHQYGMDTQASYCLIDPMIIDKEFDKYRSGKRKLENLAQFYEVKSDETFHNAEYDVKIAIQIARKMLNKFDLHMPFSTLHDRQEIWYNQQQQSLYDYFISTNNPAASSVATGWPINTELLYRQ
jgi:DNA polymerase-3 subunit epsilon